MAKKLAGVAADMIGTAVVAPPGSVSPAPSAPAKAKSQYDENLNFRVPNEFRRRFRCYAASHDMKLNEVLYKAFEAHPFQGVNYLMRPIIDADSISKVIISAGFYFVIASGSSSPLRGSGTMLPRQARKQPPSGRRLLKHPERGAFEALLQTSP
jgi:hypothetical protein